MKPLKDRISITIDSDVLAKVKDKAEYDGRSLSQYINLVLKRHLEHEEKKEKGEPVSRCFPAAGFFFFIRLLCFKK